MEIIRTIKDKDYEQLNHIKIEAGNYIHKQIETINGRTFMRIKQRKLIELMPR
jgi:hypothetical protein